MIVENLLSSIEGLLFVGVIAGLIVGLIAPNIKLGCAFLFVVPVGMIFYISWWQGQHPENLRSTSGLDFLFGPLWPSAGAIAGFYAGRLMRSRFSPP